MSVGKPVNTKRDFVKRFQQGEFGNRLQVWDSLLEWVKDPKASTSPKLFHLRNRIKGGETFYNQTSEDLVKAFNEGWGRDPCWYVSEMAPTEYTVIQGEIMKNPSYVLTYTGVKKPMRDALKEDTRYATGLVAIKMLHHQMDPMSYLHLIDLVDRYPNHVIEFSVYSVNCGIVKNRNTIIWEVRNY